MFGREHDLYVSCPGEAIRAMCVRRKGFCEAISRPGACYQLVVGGSAIPLEAVNMHTGGQSIHIVPSVEGAGGNGLGQVLVGAAIMMAAYYTAGGSLAAVAASKGASMAFSVGMSLAIGGVATMLAPSPRTGAPNERPENKPSELFDGPVNTIAQGHPIQICYGEVEIGSAIISTMIDHADGFGEGNSVVRDRGPQEPEMV